MLSRREKFIPRYTFDKHVFDIIDTEEKAYWIGFIWADGYLCIRDKLKNGTLSYEFKLSLKHSDFDHLRKFKEFLKYNGNIFTYKSSSHFGSEKQHELKEARISIYNKGFGIILSEQYGIIPNRTDATKLINSIPKHLQRHFIRGIVDADGSFTDSMTHDKKSLIRKIHVGWLGVEQLLEYTQDVLIENKIIENKSKIYRRHKDRDGNCRAVNYCGNIQCKRILNWLYDDAKIYLERKYNKYLDIINK